MNKDVNKSGCRQGFLDKVMVSADLNKGTSKGEQEYLEPNSSQRLVRVMFLGFRHRS